MRSRNLYKPDSDKPFALSRTALDSFLKCPRCFYLDRRLGVKPPAGPPFSINSAVDHLLKKEFDHYRALGQLMKLHGVRNGRCCTDGHHHGISCHIGM